MGYISSTMSNKIYLLSGNGSTKAWWEDTLPFFQTLDPVPLELPGFGDNSLPPCESLAEYADALIEMTEAGTDIFAVGINALVVLHALVRKPSHFQKTYLLAPVGAFLWERRFVKLMHPKPIRKSIHFLLRNFPRIFAKKFSSQTWSSAQYARMGEGYGKCRAFQGYFKFVNGVDAVDLFEWIEDKVVLIWGKNDAVLGLKQAAAWDTILCRADLEVLIQEDWEHYPYIDDPKGFARTLEAGPVGFRAHSKAGRLTLGRLAGLPVPMSRTAVHGLPFTDLVNGLAADKVYAVRSSGANEDQVDHSHAGRNESFLRVPKTEVKEKVQELLDMGLAEVAVQDFIEPEISGVAFVRNVAAEVEMVKGHLEGLVNGSLDPERFILTNMGKPWQAGDSNSSIPGDGQSFRKELGAFLQKCIAVFHYVHADIEWAWDGSQFHMLQIRPVTSYDWRRALTSANLDEILPKQVSRLMEHAQRRASLSIGRQYGLWDGRTLADNEPFTVTDGGASYINLDLFMARFHDWGMPSQLMAREIGGAVPEIRFSLFRFLKSIPMFLKMTRVARSGLRQSGARVAAFEKELDKLLKEESSEESLVNWFVRYYVFIVRQNMLINASLSASGGRFLGRGKTVYGQITEGSHPHRLHFESDPATSRPLVPDERLAPDDFPAGRWPLAIRMAHWLGLPGLGGYYFEVREWFRDSNMRLFHRLHQAMEGSEWFELHEGVRSRSGTFWQDGGEILQQAHGFLIQPGEANGVIGVDILVVDALEPGHFEDYKRAGAVISRTGGRLSHGATLLRELGKPSAILPDTPRGLEGKKAKFKDGKLDLEE